MWKRQASLVQAWEMEEQQGPKAQVRKSTSLSPMLLCESGAGQLERGDGSVHCVVVGEVCRFPLE